MFRPLGLLDDLSCPAHAEGRCESQRTECPFSHSIPAPFLLARAKPLAENKEQLHRIEETLTVEERSRAKPAHAPTLSLSQKPEAGPSSLKPVNRSPSRGDTHLREIASSPCIFKAENGPKDGKTLKAVNSGRAEQQKANFLQSSAKRSSSDEPGWTTVMYTKRLKMPPSDASLSRGRLVLSSPHASAKNSSGAENEGAYRHPPILTLSSNPRSSRNAFSSRNASLKTLWTVFTDAYTPLIESGDAQLQKAGRRLAHEDARTQELEVFSKASKASYRPSIVTTAVGIKKRDTEVLRAASNEARVLGSVADVVSHLRAHCSEIGTASAVQAKRHAEKQRIKSTLTISALRDGYFVCPRDRLSLYGYERYPEEGRSIDDMLGTVGGSKPSASGTTKNCMRCQKPFIVGVDQDNRACHYHWGRKFFERDPSSGERGRVQKWSCCGRSVDAGAVAGISLSAIASYGGGPTKSIEGDVTCGVGPHIFKEDSVADLHERQAFTTVSELRELIQQDDNVTGQSLASKPLEIVALDCELGFTTAGLSLTRVTVINEEGRIVLDELCKPRADMIDDNLRFSGVSAESLLQPGVKAFEEVRRDVAHLIGPQTVLIGHGLENDLRAIRLIHEVVVDTAMLFPHPQGLPFRQKLKTLAYDHLGRTIQAGPISEGHSSAEDAKASLDLVKWKLQQEPRTPFTPDPGIASARATKAAMGITGARPAATRVVSLGRTMTAGPRKAGAAAVQPGVESEAGTPPVTQRKIPIRRPPEVAATTPNLFIPRRR